MAKEQFLYPETERLMKLLDETSRRSGVSRGQAFEDTLHMIVCALSGGQLEQQYMQTVQRHTEGVKGNRGCDSITQLFAELVSIMDDTRKDVIGDLYQGAITYGEAGQYLTPESLTTLMAQLATGDSEPEPGHRKSVCDPCCGTGRMLLAVAEQNPHWEFIGQDVDLRCVRMTAINLALRNLYGYVVWGNSLTLESKLVYRTVFNINSGVIREITPEQCPYPVQQSPVEHVTQQPSITTLPPPDDDGDSVKKQGKLF